MIEPSESFAGVRTTITGPTTGWAPAHEISGLGIKVEVRVRVNVKISSEGLHLF